jgi:hypothetical protein
MGTAQNVWTAQLAEAVLNGVASADIGDNPSNTNRISTKIFIDSSLNCFMSQFALFSRPGTFNVVYVLRGDDERFRERGLTQQDQQNY